MISILLNHFIFEKTIDNMIHKLVLNFTMYSEMPISAKMESIVTKYVSKGYTSIEIYTIVAALCDMVTLNHGYLYEWDYTYISMKFGVDNKDVTAIALELLYN